MFAAIVSIVGCAGHKGDCTFGNYDSGFCDPSDYDQPAYDSGFGIGFVGGDASDDVDAKDIDGADGGDANDANDANDAAEEGDASDE